MLTARSVIIFVIVIAVLSIIGATLSLLKPPDQGGLGQDTYGTRAGGYRAIFEVLNDLGIKTQRGLLPPGGAEESAATIVFWNPDELLVRTEPVYLERVGKQIEAGGRVAIAPQAERGSRLRREIRQAQLQNELLKDTSATKELGLPTMSTELVEVSAGSSGEIGPDPSPGYRSESDDILGPELRELLSPQLVPTTTVEVAAEGEWDELGALVTTLEVPIQLQVLQLGDSKPSARLLVKDGDRPPLVLAAKYKLGQGEVIVVGDPAIFDNRLIARADNSVMAVHLLGGGGLPVVWDEFYHGLTIRGNPLFLLTQGAYAIAAVMIVAATAIWVWRQGVYLGPPLAAGSVSRRTLKEYVEAMARFFHRGAGGRRFMLEEVRHGVLWQLRHTAGARRDAETPESVAAVLARRDPQAARQLLDAVAAADLLLSPNARPTERNTLLAVKGLADCL